MPSGGHVVRRASAARSAVAGGRRGAPHRSAVARAAQESIARADAHAAWRRAMRSSRNPSSSRRSAESARCEVTETHSPAAIDSAPATSPATPVLITAQVDAPKQRRRGRGSRWRPTMPSSAPRTAARSQPVRGSGDARRPCRPTGAARRRGPSAGSRSRDPDSRRRRPGSSVLRGWPRRGVPRPLDRCGTWRSSGGGRGDPAQKERPWKAPMRESSSIATTSPAPTEVRATAAAARDPPARAPGRPARATPASERSAVGR